MKHNKEQEKMKIVLSPDPVLNKKCEEVQPEDGSIKKLARQMCKVMYKFRGVGLAAPQVGELKRIVVIDTEYTEEDENGKKIGRNPYVMINPHIVDHSNKRVTENEGCLSLPGIQVPIERWEWVEVEAFDVNGDEYSYKSDGLFGRCMQHELDHLDGITMFERLDSATRIQAIEAYQKALEAGAKPGDVE